MEKKCYTTAIQPENSSNFSNFVWPKMAKNYYYKQNMNLKYPFYGLFTWIYKIAISGY